MSLPHLNFNDFVDETDWNAMIDAVNASTATLSSGLKIATYAGTLANVQNTASETTIVSFAVPADAWTKGDVIYLVVTSLEKNNKGSGGVATFKANAGAGSQVTLGAPTFPDDPTEITTTRIFTLQRQESTVAVLRGLPSGWNVTPSNAAVQGTSTPANFTSTITVSLKATLDAASPNFYVKPQSAVAYHIKN